MTDNRQCLVKKSRQVPQRAVAHLLYWIFSNEKSLQIGLQDGVAKEHKVDEFQVFYEVVGQLFGREKLNLSSISF